MLFALYILVMNKPENCGKPFRVEQHVSSKQCAMMWNSRALKYTDLIGGVSEECQIISSDMYVNHLYRKGSAPIILGTTERSVRVY